MNTQKSICQEAHEIINERAQEKEREYGPINIMVAHTAGIASVMGNCEITPNTVFDVLIALKLSRISNNLNKRDNYLDAIAYIQAKYNYDNEA